MRALGLALILLGAGGGVAIIRYWSPQAVEARRRQRILDEAQDARDRAALLADENRNLDRILGEEVPEERKRPHDD